MVKASMPTQLALATCLCAATAAMVSASGSTATLNFINQCSYPIELYHSQNGAAVAKAGNIATGATLTQVVTGPTHMFRHSPSPSATLVELSVDSVIWYDLSIIVPMSGQCSSYLECKAGGQTGFNVPISIEPKTNTDLPHCTALHCAADDKTACADAYHFPKDDTKMRDCPLGTELAITFCFGDKEYAPPTQIGQSLPAQTGPEQHDQEQNDPVKQESLTPVVTTITEERGNAQPAQAAALGALGQVKTVYTYSGKFAGNYPGTYNRVTDLAQCTKEPVSLHSPVGPLSEPVTMIFRGPMEIYNIAVYTSAGNASAWNRASYYSRSTKQVDNMMFLNNKNVDYSGKGQHGPQGYATADGKDKADEPTVFAGTLDDASDPTQIGAGPGIATGTEVNIMTGQKCNGQCLGYASNDDYLGWGGGKKVFVTEVMMPKGAAPDRPAIWMLNAQVVHSNQYGCNCRGMGAIGGCGELDIVEVIETNAEGNMLSSHYYHFDGQYPNPGGDNFAPRRYDAHTVYVTIIDDSKDGTIKIVELDSFDFSLTALDSVYEQLLDC